jgi:hypothetical protein
MKTPEQRERARLRSERWRRRHGIGPRRPAQKPWLGLGISRSTFYRRGGKIGELTKAMEKTPTPGRNQHTKLTPDNPDRANGKIATLKAAGISTQGVSESLCRAESSLTRLQRELIACAGFMTVSASILAEFPP